MAALYLEDYLELIEQLPAELRDRFTEMRELDLQVESESKKSEERRRAFFQAAPTMTPEERNKQYVKIREEHNKIGEDADEKVNLANSMHISVERYLRQLDAELGKFKMELEADNPGITEILEKKVLDSEKATYNHLKQEKKKRSHPPVVSDIIKVNGIGGRESAQLQTASATSGSRSAEPMQISTGISPGQQRSMISPNTSGGVSPNSSLTGASPQSHRKAQNYGEMSRMNIGGPSPFTHRGGQSSFLHAFEGDPRTGRARKLTTRVGEMLKEAAHRQEHRTDGGHFLAPSTSYSGMGGAGTSGTAARAYGGGRKHDGGHYSADEDESDPNEPRYCICNQVSYGEMVACDNKDCPFEWFHYACVGITQPPKGKWYCPQCTSAMKRRASRMLQALQNS